MIKNTNPILLSFLLAGDTADINDRAAAAADLWQLAVPLVDLFVFNDLVGERFVQLFVGCGVALRLDFCRFRRCLRVGDGGLLFGFRLQELLLRDLLFFDRRDKGFGEVKVDDIDVGDIQAKLTTKPSEISARLVTLSSAV